MTTAIDTRRWADLRTISLVGLAHGTSHSFHLLLQPLFPVFISEAADRVAVFFVFLRDHRSA
jgi:MFS transporter, FSR family, fosmidomycin resistance protein